jgi:hypothetical protein
MSARNWQSGETWGNATDDALFARLLDHAAQYNDPLPMPDPGEVFDEYLARLDREERIQLYDRSVMTDARKYLAITRDAEEHGKLLIERDVALDEAPVFKGEHLRGVPVNERFAQYKNSKENQS